MAEIKLKKKKPVWPWILLALLILAVIGILFMTGDDDGDTMAVNDNTEYVEPADDQEMETAGNENQAVSDYITYIEDNSAQMGLDHEYTHRAFSLLAGAMQATAEGMNFEFDQDWQALNQEADKIREDPMKLTHANTIKDGFDQVVTSFNNIQQSEFPEMDSQVRTLEEFSNEMNPDEPTLDQKEKVKGFFEQAAMILEEMNNQNS
jgi:hypothetical protein